MAISIIPGGEKAKLDFFRARYAAGFRDIPEPYLSMIAPPKPVPVGAPVIPTTAEDVVTSGPPVAPPSMIGPPQIIPPESYNVGGPAGPAVEDGDFSFLESYGEEKTNPGPDGGAQSVRSTVRRKKSGKARKKKVGKKRKPKAAKKTTRKKARRKTTRRR